MKNGWHSIAELPKLTFNDSYWESPTLLVWVANASEDSHVNFGRCHKSGRTGKIMWQANGFSRSGWDITHWQCLPGEP